MGFDMALFSERLKAARMKKGINQTALAELCDTQQSKISGCEHGSKAPNLAEAAKIADVLGVSLDWLCGADVEQKEITPLQWLSYMDKLISNPPRGKCPFITFEEKSGGGELTFFGTEMEELFSAYSSILKMRKQLGKTYDSVVKSVLEKYSYLFVPGLDTEAEHKMTFSVSVEKTDGSTGRMTFDTGAQVGGG